MDEPIIQLASAPEPVMTPVSPQNNKFDVSKLLLPGAILLAAIMVSGSLFYTRGSQVGAIGAQATPDPNRKVTVSVDDDPVLGKADAPVTIVEFSDFQCPFCRKWYEDSFAQLKKDYIDTGKVKLVYRDFPLSIHPSAEIAAEAGECAHEQGKFWEFHDVMFEEQAKGGTGTIPFTAQDLKNWAGEIGTNAKQFASCLDSSKYKNEIAHDQADGNTAGVTGTPSFVIAGHMVVGAQPYSVFQSAIDAALK